MDANFVEIGKQLFRGVLQELGVFLLFLFLFVVVAGFIMKAFSVGLDSTDKSKWNRSGLKLMIDNKTGVNYLSDGKGGMHVRIDAQGKPIIGNH